MGMGYAPAFIVKIEQEDIEKLNLSSYGVFMKTLSDSNLDFDSTAQIITHIERDYGLADPDNWDIDTMSETYDVDNNIISTIVQTYLSFCNEFKKVFHLNISCGYHNNNDYGNRYDDVKGGFLQLNYGEVYQLSEHAEKLKVHVPFEIAQFVEYG